MAWLALRLAQMTSELTECRMLLPRTMPTLLRLPSAPDSGPRQAVSLSPLTSVGSWHSVLIARLKTSGRTLREH